MSDIKLFIEKWLNVDKSFDEKSFKGKVIAIHAFQMLCPGCVLHGIPQAQKLFETFNPEHVQVLGLHTVFEHHEAMEEKSLRAFLHEFRVRFPVGIDSPSPNQRIPQTMDLYQTQGTPTWLIFDRKGELKVHAFGKLEDLVLGSEITRLALQEQPSPTNLYKNRE